MARNRSGGTRMEESAAFSDGDYGRDLKESSNRRKRFGIKFIVRAFFILLIILVYLLLFGRMALAKERGIMKKYITDAEGAGLVLNTQKLDENIDEDGKYYISRPTICFEESRLEITARYNNSVFDTLRAAYGDVPTVGETFVFMLSDDSGNVYDSYRYAESSNMIYNFRRVIFDDIDYKAANKLYLTVFYIDDATDSSPMTVSFKVYDADSELLKDDSKTADYTALKNSPVYRWGE